MPVIKGIPFLTNTVFKKVKHVGWFSFPVGLILVTCSVVESRMVANPFPFLWIPAYSLYRVSLHSNVFQSIDFFVVLCMQYSLFLSLYEVAPESSGLFRLSLMEREMLLAIFLYQVSDHHLFKSGVVSRLTLLDSNLNVQRHSWL